MSIIIFLIVLAVLILSHELGHFLAARSAGVRVDEFGLGFPPKIAGFKKGETLYSLNAIPFGGFVKIFGENPDEESTAGPDKDRSLVNKPRLIQAWVLFAGVFFNFLLAWFLLSAGLMVGLPASQEIAPAGYELKEKRLMIANVAPDSPAQKAGIKPGSIVVYAESGGRRIENPQAEALESFIRERENQEIDLGLIEQTNKESLREVKKISVTPQAGIVADKAAIGVALENIGILQLPLFPAFYEGLNYTVKLVWFTIAAFGQVISSIFQGQSALEAVTGPVGLVGVVGTSAALGISYLLYLTALISINLAIINLLPFPALDGGRLFFLGIEGVRNKPLNPKFANTANTIGFFLLLLLMAVITYRDIARLISK